MEHGSGPIWKAVGQARFPTVQLEFYYLFELSALSVVLVGLLFTPGMTLHTLKKDKEIFAKDISDKGLLSKNIQKILKTR